MRLNPQLVNSVHAAPAWALSSSCLNHSRCLSSTAQRLSDSSNSKKDEKSNESNKQSSENPSTSDSSTKQESGQQQPAKAKSVNATDNELRERLEQMSGGGGASGIEYEDGQPTTMKRSVRNNMFRYI